MQEKNVKNRNFFIPDCFFLKYFVETAGKIAYYTGIKKF